MSNVIYYKFGFELFGRTCPSLSTCHSIAVDVVPIKWELLRFDIENKHHFYKKSKKSSHKCSSYVQARIWPKEITTLPRWRDLPILQSK